jgi:hypothetical protein
MVQDFHKEVDGFEIEELVVGDVHTEDEVQAGVATVNQLVGLVLQKKAGMNCVRGCVVIIMELQDHGPQVL